MEQTALPNDNRTHFRTILEARLADLEKIITPRDAIAIEQTPDAIEEIQRASERALAISNLVRESKQLRNVRAAIRRIHEGTFGICEDCEEQISPKRLSAIPWASLCVVCQEARDSQDEPSAPCFIEQHYAA